MHRTLEQWRTAIDGEARSRQWPFRCYVRRVHCPENMGVVIAEFTRFTESRNRWFLRVVFDIGELESIKGDWRDAVRIIIEGQMVKHTEAHDMTVAERRNANEYFGILDCFPYRESWQTDEDVLRISAKRRGPVHEPVE